MAAANEVGLIMALRDGLPERTTPEADADEESDVDGTTAALKLRRWLEGVLTRAELGTPPVTATVAAAAAVPAASVPGTNGTV